jgi:hypothetical protein
MSAAIAGPPVRGCRWKQVRLRPCRDGLFELAELRVIVAQS